MSGRGRRPAGSGTREAIEAAARRQFGALGYQGATMRGIAAEAGVDPRLVSHFFGSKEQLFVAVAEPPIDPAQVIRELTEAGTGDIGHRLAAVVLDMLDDARARSMLTGLVRAAASEEAAAMMVRALVTERLLEPVARQAGGANPELRAALLGSQIVGLVFARHVVGIQALAEAEREQLVSRLGPVLQHYLTGDLGGD